MRSSRNRLVRITAAESALVAASTRSVSGLGACAAKAPDRTILESLEQLRLQRVSASARYVEGGWYPDERPGEGPPSPASVGEHAALDRRSRPRRRRESPCGLVNEGRGRPDPLMDEVRDSPLPVPVLPDRDRGSRLSGTAGHARRRASSSRPAANAGLHRAAAAARANAMEDQGASRLHCDFSSEGDACDEP